MENCIFCNIINAVRIQAFCDEFPKERIVYQDDTWLAIYDNYPVSQGHVLLMPKRHCETYFDLNYVELASLGVTIGIIKFILNNKFHPTGYNIGVNCGKSAGQTVMHCHIHIIPRYDGDMEDPRGGVRGVIPEKQKY
jgi:diadenosine tetraphosphate (Ap4A) HIT family hydrolase